jgi:ABC-type multidrug transport system fused ATPase/permease subunit
MFLFKEKLIAAINLSRKAFGAYKWQILTLTVLGFLNGLFEGIGINALIPLFSFVVGGQNKADDLISQLIERFFLYINVDFTLKYLLIFIVLLFTFKAIALIFFHYIGVRITADYEKRTRSDLFKKTLKAGWPYLLRQKLGHLETVLMTDVRFAGILLRSISSVIMVLTSLLVYIFIAFNISFYITLITLGLGGLIFFAFKPLVLKTRIAARHTARLNKQIAHYINENILGMKTVKTAIVGNKLIEKGEQIFEKFRKLKVRLFMLKSITGSLLQPISLIFVSLVFAFSYKTPGFNFAALLAVIYLIQRIFQYIQQFLSNLHKISESIPYLKSIMDYGSEADRNVEYAGGPLPFKFNRELKFDNMSFAYSSGENVLSNINFSVTKGKMVGLIGSSGSGKTTLVDLVLRLFQPISGRILLDGNDISRINLDEWRDKIGYISQDIFLINDTIENNIKFYDNSISKSDVKRASKMADIYDFIESLPKKFDTVVGERGVLLSAGQRQRIVIARILARKPEFLILDEATSALDHESEAKIQKIIERLKGKLTVIIIAHRLSTVLNCDSLIVLEQGRIVEEGSPRELLKDKDSAFFKIYHIRR